MVKQNNRFFGDGEQVRVAKKSHVIDREREHEGAKPGTLPPIEQDVTGIEGEVAGASYDNPERNEVMVPIRLKNDAVIAVPEHRLEAPRGVSRSRSGGGDRQYARNYDRVFRKKKGKGKKASRCRR